jgi:hypothetical protein
MLVHAKVFAYYLCNLWQNQAFFSHVFLIERIGWLCILSFRAFWVFTSLSGTVPAQLISMSHRSYRKFSRHHILGQKDPWEVARNAFEISLELALLGSVEEATRLFTLFENFSAECKPIWSPGLYFAWEATDLWPDCVPASERTLEALRKLEIERILWKRETSATDAGLDSLIRVATGDGKKGAWGHAQLRRDDLTAAVDLAIHMNKAEKAGEIIQIIAENFDRMWIDLSKSRKVWSYLKDGILTRAIGIDVGRLRDFQNEAYSTFEERIKNGPRRLLKNLSMKELVDMCNDNTLRNAVWEEMEVDSGIPPETILHKGATREEVVALEQRLGLDLPEDYKEFLIVTNGLESVWNGFHGEPKLLGTDAVHKVDATEQQRAIREASVNVGFYMNMSVKVDWEPMTDVIQVNDGTEDSKFVWLLDPEHTKRTAARFFAAIAQLPAHELAHVREMLEHFHAGVEDGSQLDWVVCVWSPQTLELANYNSWREYLEVVAGEAANEDTVDEVDEDGRMLHSLEIIAYQLRRRSASPMQ